MLIKKSLEELRKQVIAENEIIKQGYSDKKVARLNDIAEAEAAADATAAKEAADRAKQIMLGIDLMLREKSESKMLELSGSDMEQERLTIINDHIEKLEAIKNNAKRSKVEKDTITKIRG
jgi:hypothetical protein